MPPSPRMHKPNAPIILKNVVDTKKDSEIWKKLSSSLKKLVETNPLIYNTLHFDQYSRLAIRRIFFGFRPIIRNEFEI